MTLSLALDVLVAALLVITIALAAVLNHRLGKLRRERGELEKLTTEFQEATTKAQEASRNLKIDADSMQDDITKAQSLTDDLNYLIERAGSAADRLEEQIRTARKQGEGSTSAPPSPVTQLRPGAHGAPASARSQAERDLLNALRSTG